MRFWEGGMTYRIGSYRGVTLSKRPSFHGVPKAYLFMIDSHPFIVETLMRAIFFIDLNKGEI